MHTIVGGVDHKSTGKKQETLTRSHNAKKQYLEVVVHVV